VAEVRPFRALRYDTAKAGPLENLVAPPYDVLSDEQRRDNRERSPYNVVHLTLPESEEQAARDFAGWQREGVLVEEEPAFWALEQEYVGPDGVARVRRGIVVSLKAEPYEHGVVLPHERTYAEARERRLRLVRAVGAQLEPIFLLYKGSPPVSPPGRAPDVDVPGTRLWRLAEVEAITDAFAEKQLLIADGHHRYETAVEFARRDGSPWLLAVLVSASDPGLMIFPTHRIAGRFEASNSLLLVESGPAEALERLPAGRAACVVYARGRTFIAENGSQPDTAFVESLGPADVRYTPDLEEAVAAVDEGTAEAAFLVRPTRIEQVFDVARRGQVMPPKSTYFYPKLLSGLLFHPL
jgi:uncharacterized protein (DUF1015 family)